MGDRFLWGFCLVIFGLLILAGIFIYRGHLHQTNATSKTITLSCPIGYVCFKPENVECYIWDMTIGGYIPLAREKRQYVSSLVKKKHAKIKRLEDAIDCYHMAADDKLGDKVVTLTASWWKWEKR